MLALKMDIHVNKKHQVFLNLPDTIPVGNHRMILLLDEDTDKKEESQGTITGTHGICGNCKKF